MRSDAIKRASERHERIQLATVLDLLRQAEEVGLVEPFDLGDAVVEHLRDCGLDVEDSNAPIYSAVVALRAALEPWS